MCNITCTDYKETHEVKLLEQYIDDYLTKYMKYIFTLL